jgi:hypothetical protein
MKRNPNELIVSGDTIYVPVVSVREMDRIKDDLYMCFEGSIAEEEIKDLLYANLEKHALMNINRNTIGQAEGQTTSELVRLARKRAMQAVS